MSVNFFYLRGAFYDSPGLQSEHEAQVEALLNGDVGLDQVEPLQDGVWSLRTSLKGRLLFTIEEIEEIDESGKLVKESYLSVLEYLPNHEYDKSRFLQSGVFKKYQAKNKALYARLAALSKEEQLKTQMEMLEALKTTYKKKGKGGKPQVLEFYQNEFLILNPLQNEALKLSLPAILSGVAGSGKSVIAITSIANYVTHLSTTPRRRVLYICKSEALVQQNKAYWNALPASKIKDHTVDFISIEFLKSQALMEQGATEADEDFFKEFCHSYCSRKNKRFAADPKKIREEFLICSGFDEKTYSELGDKQSTVSKAQRTIYYAAYQAYLKHLEIKKKVDADFFNLDLDDYDLIAMDEAQDLSYHAVNSIHSKAQAGNILYCMDSHQRLGSSKSIRPFLLNKIGNDPKRHVSLVSTHRCPVKVVNVANEVLTFKQLMVEGIGDKYETPNIQSVASEKGMGSAYVCDEESLLGLKWMAQPKQAYFVVITSKKNCENPETLAAIKKRFNTDNVLSAEDAKGLEYDVVLAYDLYDEEVFKSLKDKIEDLNEESKPSVHQPKDSSGNEDCASFFNGVYTAYTRAKTAVIVCEKETRHNKALLDKVKNAADKGLPPEDLFSRQSTKEEWELEVTNQLQAGNNKLAKNTYFNKLVVNKELKEQEYETFVKEFIKKLEAQKTPSTQPKVGESKPSGTKSFEKKQEQWEVEVTGHLKTGNKKLAENTFFYHYLGDPKSKAAAFTAFKSDFDAKANPSVKPILSESIRPPKTTSLEEKNSEALQFTGKDTGLLESIENPTIAKKEGDKQTTEIVSKAASSASLAQLLEDRLFKEFNEAHFMNLMRLHKENIKPLDKIMRIDDQGKPQSLLNFIKADPERCKLLLKWASNNLFILVKMNLELTSPEPDPFMRSLHQLQRIQEFLQLNDSTHDEFTKLIPESTSQGLLRINSQRARSGTIEDHIPHLQNLIDLGAELLQLKKSSEVKGFNILAHFAASLGDIKVLEFLHQKGVDLSETNPDDGNHIAHIAAMKGHATVFKLLKKHNLTDLLKKPNNLGFTPVFFLTINDHFDALSEFQELGYELDASINGEGKRPSHVAARDGRLEILKKLASFGINLDQPDAEGRTPLVWAVQKNHLEVVSYLVRKKVNSSQSFYLSCEKLVDLFKEKTPYALELKEQIKYLERTKNLRKKLKQGPNGKGEIPINLAQLAQALGNEKTAKLLRGPILEPYLSEQESKTEVPEWTHFFSITEPHLNTASINPTLTQQLQKIMLERILNEDTLNEASLIALIEHTEYKKIPLDQIPINYKGNNQSLLSHIGEHKELAKLFFKHLVNNTFLLTNVFFTPNLEELGSYNCTLAQLDWVKQNFKDIPKALVEREVPIHLLVQYYAREDRDLIQHNTFMGLFEFLLQYGADLTIPNRDGTLLIHWAVLNNHLELLELIADKTDLSALTSNGCTVAHLAAEKNNIIPLFKLLKDKNLTSLLFQPDHKGSTPAHILAEHNFFDAFTELAKLRGDFELDAPDFLMRYRPSHKAAQEGHIEIIDQLQRLKINVDQTARNGSTPLCLAIKNSQRSIVGFLLACKVNLNRRTPVNWAVIYHYIASHLSPTPYLSLVNQFKLDNPHFKQGEVYIPLNELAALRDDSLIHALILQQQNAITYSEDDCLSWYVNTENLKAQLASACIAAYMNDLEFLKFLDAKGVNLNGLDDTGYNLAHYAAQNNSVAVLNWIIQKLDPNYLFGNKLDESVLDINAASTTCGIKPVHIAASKGHVEALGVFQSLDLLEELSPDGRSSMITPLVLAILSGQLGAIKFLLDSGVKIDTQCLITLETIDFYTCDFSSVARSSIYIKFRNKMLDLSLKGKDPVPLNAEEIATILGFTSTTLLLLEAKEQKHKVPNNKPFSLGKNPQVFYPTSKNLKESKDPSLSHEPLLNGTSPPTTSFSTPVGPKMG